MWKFILVTFATLGFLFYEMSGGSEFQPTARTEAPMPRTADAPRPTLAAIKPVPAQRPVLSTSSNKRVLQGGTPSDTQVTLASASVDLPIAAPRRDSLFTVVGKAPERARPEPVAAAPERKLPANFAAADRRVVAKSRVNMRGGPGTNYEVVARLTDGDEVLVLEDDGTGWVKLRVEETDEIGWMADFLLTAAR